MNYEIAIKCGKQASECLSLALRNFDEKLQPDEIITRKQETIIHWDWTKYADEIMDNLKGILERMDQVHVEEDGYEYVMMQLCENGNISTTQNDYGLELSVISKIDLT